jgi:SAM-dependent methyltransferase
VNTGPSGRAKPRGLGPDYAAQFCDASVADAYQHRPPYPLEVFDILADLVKGEPRRVLDLGCGRGEIARPLLDRVDQIDAVDASAAMIERGRALPGGDGPRLHWIVGPAESAALRPPYGLVVAASSLHWMDWEIVLPRLREALRPGAFVAIFDDQTMPIPWTEQLNALIPRYSTNREFEPYRLLDELESRGLFRLAGSRRTQAVPFRQPIDAYVESFHSRNGFSRQRQSVADARAFDDAVRAIVAPHAVGDGEVELELCSTVHWGWPCC